jgi:hypothetical protein
MAQVLIVFHHTANSARFVDHQPQLRSNGVAMNEQISMFRAEPSTCTALCGDETIDRGQKMPEMQLGR